MLFYILIFLSIVIGIFMGIFTSMHFIKGFNNVNSNKKYKNHKNFHTRKTNNQKVHMEKSKNKNEIETNSKYRERLKTQKDIQNDLDLVEIMNALEGNDAEEYLKTKRAQEDKGSFGVLKKYSTD